MAPGKAHNATAESQETPATMTTGECIDLVSPEADKQPCARRSALPSHEVAVTLSFDLTANTNTPPPVSARGIADDENYHRGGGDAGGGDARNDSNRPPDIPRLHEMREDE